MDSNDDLWKLLSSENERERNKGHELLMIEMKGLIIKELMGFGASLEEAEEVFFDGLVVIDTKSQKKDFGPNDNIQGYLRRTCKFIQLRKKDREKIKLKNIDDYNDFFTVEDVVISGLTDKAVIQKIEHVFNQLKPKCKSILSLSFFGGLDPQEILERLELTSLDVLKTTKNRCMKKLREIVSALGGKGFFVE